MTAADAASRAARFAAVKVAFRRRHLPGAQAIADLLEPLDRSIRNLRVLVRRAAVGTKRHEVVPAAYVALIDELARSCDDIAREVHERHEPVLARPGLRRLGERSAAIDPASGLSGEVIRAQARSMVVDLLVLTGLSLDEAGAYVPVVRSGDPWRPRRRQRRVGTVLGLPVWRLMR